MKGWFVCAKPSDRAFDGRRGLSSRQKMPAKALEKDDDRGHEKGGERFADKASHGQDGAIDLL